MADDLNRLLIKIQADTSQLASALQAAEAGVAQSSQRIERSLDRNSNKFKKWGDDIGRQFKGLVAGYLGIELASKALNAVDVVANLEDQAQAAGLTTDQFQELAYAAKLSGASTEDLAQGLDKFSVSMGQVRLNTGQFNEFLLDQAPALRDALAATTTQEQAVKVLSDAMAGLGDDSQRATLLQEAFGKSGRELIGVLSEGSRALDESAQKAHEFGIVLTNEDIKAAKEASEEFKNLEIILTTTFEKAAISAASFAKSVAEALKHPITALGELIDKMNNMPGAYGGRGGARNPASMGGTSFDLFAPTTKGWDATVTKAPSWALRPKPDQTGSNKLASLTQQFDQSNGNIQQVLQDQYDQELKQWQDMLDKKQISESQFAEARTQLSVIMLNAQKANLNAETEQEREYLTTLRDDFNSTFMDAFGNALDGGKFKASEFFNSLLKDFAKVTTEVLVLKPLLNGLFGGLGSAGGGGGLGGIVGSLFGGFLASGGPANADTPYIVGEKGPELFVPNAAGRVKTTRETEDIFAPSFGGRSSGRSVGNGSTSGGIGTFIYSPQVDARGADMGVAQRLGALARSDAAQVKLLAAINGRGKRFPTRG